jgi:hypothetical protein
VVAVDFRIHKAGGVSMRLRHSMRKFLPNPLEVIEAEIEVVEAFDQAKKYLLNK